MVLGITKARDWCLYQNSEDSCRWQEGWSTLSGLLYEWINVGGRKADQNSVDYSIWQEGWSTLSGLYVAGCWRTLSGLLHGLTTVCGRKVINTQWTTACGRKANQHPVDYCRWQEGWSTPSGLLYELTAVGGMKTGQHSVEYCCCMWQERWTLSGLLEVAGRPVNTQWTPV